jgi:hypothetical protein
MDFDRIELNSLLNQKLEKAERAIIRNYLKDCGVGSDEIAERVNSIIEERSQSNSNISAELERAQGVISQLEERIRQQSVGFAVREILNQLGVKKELCNDVKLLAAEGINAAVDSDGVVDTAAVHSAIAAVIDRIPSVAETSADTGANSDSAQHSETYTGNIGNFARNNDSATLMKNRLNSARATGNNALSVSIISEAASMGISLR